MIILIKELRNNSLDTSKIRKNYYNSIPFSFKDLVRKIINLIDIF